jgi:site-specific recombinase XerD
LRHLRAYLDTYRQGAAACRALRGASEDHLFLSETGRPLTKNGMALLFARLRKRAGIRRKGVNPSLIRESFALRFLQTGGEPLILQELLGYTE